jgi:hypothetical protein
MKTKYMFPILSHYHSDTEVKLFTVFLRLQKHLALTNELKNLMPFVPRRVTALKS